jgi:exodeoxyribonuclease V
MSVLAEPAPALPAPKAAPTTEFSFGPQQGKVLKEVEAWLSGHTKGTEKKQVYRLFGFAGSGKTTLAKHLAASVKGRVCFAAYTGKAALMMERNGCHGASTIHSLLYKAEMGDDGGVDFRFNRRSPASKAALIVIDECSMVDEKIGTDLLRFGVPILVLGDPAQLPPIKGNGFFTHGCEPDAMLTEIHRQARDNPIIRFATDVREGRGLPYGVFDTVEIDRPGNRGPAEVAMADQIICGRNATRSAFNSRIRAHLGHDELTPAVGDRLVCLRNDMKKGLMNGGLFTVDGYRPEARRDVIGLNVSSEDFAARAPIPVGVRREFFDGDPRSVSWEKLKGTQQFDYGYALTGHKSQGSQWRHVIAYDESATFGADAKRWLYTVITRASERLTIIR